MSEINHTYPIVNIEDRTYLQVCKSHEIYEGRSFTVFFEEELQVAIFRIQGQLYAVSNICLHQHAAVLCDGYVEGTTVRCPLHGWVYSLETGQTIGSPSHLATYRIYEHSGLVYLEEPTARLPKWMDSL